MKKYLLFAVPFLFTGLLLSSHIFGAVSDADWKKDLAKFNESYAKAKTQAQKAVYIRRIAEVDHPDTAKVLIGTVLPREIKENELLNLDIVVTYLGKLTDSAAIAELIASAKKSNPPDKTFLIQALGKISDDSAKALLLELLKHNDNSVKVAAIDALAESSPPEAFNTILEYLDYKSWEVKVSAIAYLGKLKDEGSRKKAVEILRSKINSETGRIRNDLSDAIRQIMSHSGGSEEGGKSSGATYTFFDIALEGDVVFVIDNSMSMSGKNKDGVTRWDKLVEELKKSLDQMSKFKPPVKFNIIAYSEKLMKFQPTLVSIADSKDAAIKWIETMKPGKLGMYTNIYDSLEMALVSPNTAPEGQKYVFSSGAPNAYTICLMTDGKANRGKYVNPDDILVALKMLNQSRKIRINTIALDFGVAEAQPQGMGAMYAVDAGLMEQIAKEHNGTCVKF